MAEAPEDGLNEAPHFHGHRDRLRARFRSAGAQALADYELLELVQSRQLKVLIDRQWPLDDGAKALASLEDRKVFGKVLVAIANKHARQLWAMLARQEEYDAEAWLRHPMVQRPASRKGAVMPA